MASQQVWVTNSLGGYSNCPKLDKKLWEYAKPLMRFRQFCNIKSDAGKNVGNVSYFDKISKLTTAGGTLVETSTIPKSNFVMGRGTATVEEYGNSVPYTGKLETLSQFNIDNAVHKTLLQDEAETLDKAAGTQFQDTLAKYVCYSDSAGYLTTNGTATYTSTGNLCYYHVKKVCDQLRKWNVKPYDSQGNYVCVGSVDAIGGVKDDTKWRDAYLYGKPEQLLTNEAGKLYGCRFVEETNHLVNTKGGSYAEAVIFGADAVQEIVVLPPEVRRDPPTDAGRSKLLAWYAMMTWKIMWCGNSGETGDSVDTSKGWVPHIIHVTSA